jgi:hypothetical protein
MAMKLVLVAWLHEHRLAESGALCAALAVIYATVQNGKNEMPAPSHALLPLTATA